jgi:hypothetical protein
MTTPTCVELNLLDELFLNLDHAEEPWTVHFEVRVGERLDAERLAGAIAGAAQRHPIARASLASWSFRDRRYNWEIADTLTDVPLLELECHDEAALGSRPARRSTPHRRSRSCWPTALQATQSS